MSKQVRVLYTLEVEKVVTITDETPPAPYSPEEWEDQQIQNVGDDIAMMMEGSPSMTYRRLG